MTKEQEQISAIDGLLTFIAINAVARNIASGKDGDLETCQKWFIRNKLAYIIDALKVIKKAKKNKDLLHLISKSNSDWSNMVGRVAKVNRISSSL